MLKIHPATREDIPALLALIRELATYEKKRHKAVGYASFFHFYSTFQGRPALFLEDLFVLDEFRGKGIGKALLVEVARLAVEEGCFGLRWEVLDWNRPAIEFYEKLGATFLNERKVASFDSETMRRMAEGK
jgi:GNAT superfamily N-acetyltransferase